MEILVILILSVLIFFVGKFVYDSFITNNTNNRWNEFKKYNSDKSSEIENDVVGAIPFDSEKNQWHKTRSDLYNEALSSLRCQIEEIKKDNPKLDHLSKLLLMTETITEYSEHLEARFIKRSEELKLEEITIRETIKTATRNCLEEYSGIDLGGKQTNLKQYQENEEQKLSKNSVRLILNDRTVLEEGRNLLVAIHSIEQIMEKPNRYLICFEALNAATKLKAMEYMKNGEYKAAINQRVCTEVGSYVAKQLLEMNFDYVDIEGVVKGTADNGRVNIEVGNIFPPTKPF